VIEISAVSKSYGGTTVLEDVSVTFEDGSLTCLIGPNGAGKSTLLSAASRLMQPDTGSVQVAGLDIFTESSRDIAKHLAVLRQFGQVNARIRVEELVGFGRFPHTRGKLTAQDMVFVDDALEQLDLIGLRHRFLDQLSGGQRQRAFIAMALAQHTDHLLLDEPLNNLDLRHSLGTMRLLRELCELRSLSVVAVVHDINVAAAFADRIVAMKDGRIMAEGTPSEIMTTEVLYELYGVELEIVTVGGSIFAAFRP